MRIARYVPRLTGAELNRCHLSPADSCELAGIGLGSERTEREARKFISNLSDRGHLPFEKSGTARTSPKLYSLKSCILLRAMHDLTTRDNRRPNDYALPIAKAVADHAETLIASYHDIDRFQDADGFRHFIIYGGGGSSPKPVVITRDEFAPENVVRGPDNGVYAADELIWHLLTRYPDYWYRDRLARGLEAPEGRYRGCDEKGYPLDPAHPSNASLPPLERAKRLLEIEEYIAKLEAQQSGQANGEA